MKSTNKRPAMSVDEYRSRGATLADAYIRRAQAECKALDRHREIERRRRADDLLGVGRFAAATAELTASHTALLAATGSGVTEPASDEVGVVVDVNGDSFEVGYHYFPDAPAGEATHMVTLGPHGTAIAVDQVAELVRMLLLASAGACNHRIAAEAVA